MAQAKVATVLVTYNGSSFIERCLDAVVDWNPIVVDNCSTDNTVELIRSKYPQAEVIVSPENKGYGQGANLGIKKALEQDFEYILLINQDAKLEAECVEKLLKVAEFNLDLGIVAPLTLDGEKVDTSFLKNLSSCSVYISDLILYRQEEFYRTGFLPGAVWLVRREVFKIAGFFDSLFFMHGVDHDYYYRMKYHGFEMGFVPQAKAVHAYSVNVEDPKAAVPFKQRLKKLWWLSVLGLKRPDRSFIYNMCMVFGRFAQQFLRDPIVVIWTTLKTILLLPKVWYRRRRDMKR